MVDAALVACILLAAILYSSVGHAGASGYLAAMALFGVAPEEMRPSALVLNVLVAAIGTVRFSRAGCFSWQIFWPFALTSIPCAYLGGVVTLPGSVYKPIVGLVLLFAAYRLIRNRIPTATRRIPLPVGLACGAGIGLLSGLTGTGGGIFLSPLLLVAGWADTRRTAGVSAAFILVNSTAGLLGLMSKTVYLPAMLPYWVIAAMAGGLIGADLGSKRLGSPMLRRLLAAVLTIAALKLFFA